MRKQLSDRARRIGKEYVFAPGGFGLDWDELNVIFDQPQCYLVFLDDLQIAVILALFKFLKFHWLWGFLSRGTWDVATAQKWDDISAFIAEMEHCLMSGCNAEDLIKTQRMLVAAITGESIDLDADLPTGVVDFSAVGLSPKFEGANGNITVAVEALETALENIQTAIEATTAGDLEDDLANVWTVLQAITLVLGGTVPPPSPPL